MNRLTPEQRLQIVEIYFQNQCSVKKISCSSTILFINEFFLQKIQDIGVADLSFQQNGELDHPLILSTM